MSKIDISGIVDEDIQPKKKKSTIRKGILGQEDMAGSVSQTIGTGKHAQDSVVWLTIKWSFIIGSILSFILIAFMWPSSPEGVHPPIAAVFPIEHLKVIWSIFIPIVTLALGYMFGKGK
ncbi:hypothetical protein [Photobacterium leiognathi]|uniref:hypothetical protein n=1 Tax=Photobacterium leiognathi TaxID=553611 RepID=UPI0029816526|nr:hypothetical protein [Photobacterium leiognathi]